MYCIFRSARAPNQQHHLVRSVDPCTTLAFGQRSGQVTGPDADASLSASAFVVVRRFVAQSFRSDRRYHTRVPKRWKTSPSPLTRQPSQRAGRAAEIARRAPCVEEVALVVAHATPMPYHDVPNKPRRRGPVPTALGPPGAKVGGADAVYKAHGKEKSGNVLLFGPARALPRDGTDTATAGRRQPARRPPAASPKAPAQVSAAAKFRSKRSVGPCRPERTEVVTARSAWKPVVCAHRT